LKPVLDYNLNIRRIGPSIFYTGHWWRLFPDEAQLTELLSTSPGGGSRCRDVSVRAGGGGL